MKSALVTGCSTGIGLETAKALAARDFHVLAGARSPSDLEMLDGLHKGISAVKLDVTSDTDVDSALARLPTDSLDLLVNNAGVSIVGAVETASMEALTGLLEGGVNSPTDPKEVADVVVEAALSASPKTRYLVGQDIPDWEHLRGLPDRERDAQNTLAAGPFLNTN